jgi:hypothetical protein
MHTSNILSTISHIHFLSLRSFIQGIFPDSRLLVMVRNKLIFYAKLEDNRLSAVRFCLFKNKEFTYEFCFSCVFSHSIFNSYSQLPGPFSSLWRYRNHVLAGACSWFLRPSLPTNRNCIIDLVNLAMCSANHIFNVNPGNQVSQIFFLSFAFPAIMRVFSR